MKKMIALIILIVCLIVPCAVCEQESDWSEAPIITRAYEQAPEQLYLEWQGNAPLYRVSMDGKAVVDAIANNAVLPIKKGAHSICVYPVYEEKNADTNFNVEVNVEKIGIGGNLDIDLGALGLDPKKLVLGNPSEPMSLDYIPDPLFSSTPEDVVFLTDFENRTKISFKDHYNSDEYEVKIISGKNEGYVRFSAQSEESSKFIEKDNTLVTLTLDQDYLMSQGCIVPELDNKYAFVLRFRKYATEIQSGEKVTTVIHESKDTKKTEYTPKAAWKEAPTILGAEQTGDGEVTLQWSHDDGGLGCEYVISRVSKTLGFKSKDETVGTTKEKEITISDLTDDSYIFIVTAQSGDEKGKSSSETKVEVHNSWMAAPDVNCEQVGAKQARLTWKPSAGIDHYVITVSVGNSKSLLKYVDQDYSKYDEIEIEATEGEMEYLFEYDGKVDAEDGLKVKFDIQGIHTTENGEEQKSEKGTYPLVLK